MRKNIYLIYAMEFLQGMVFYAPVSTLYRQRAGVSFFEISIIEGISMALMLLLEVPWGAAADKIGYRKTVIICGMLLFASKMVFWQADDFTGFLMERILMSAAACTVIAFTGSGAIAAAGVLSLCFARAIFQPQKYSTVMFPRRTVPHSSVSVPLFFTA